MYINKYKLNRFLLPILFEYDIKSILIFVF